MDKAINEVVNNYFNNKNLKKFSDIYYSNYNYTEVAKSKAEMNIVTMGIDATLNYYLGLEGLTDGDIEIMERRVAEYELIVLKIFSSIKDTKLDYNNYDLQNFIDNISKYYDKLNDIYKIKKTDISKIGFTF